MYIFAIYFCNIYIFVGSIFLFSFQNGIFAFVITVGTLPVILKQLYCRRYLHIQSSCSSVDHMTSSSFVVSILLSIHEQCFGIVG